MRLGKWVLTMGAVGLLAGTLQFGVSFAATDNNAAFLAQYLRNAQLETTLWQQLDTTAASNGSDAGVYSVAAKLYSQNNSLQSLLYQDENAMDAMVEGRVKQNTAQLTPNLLQVTAKVDSAIAPLLPSQNPNKKANTGAVPAHNDTSPTPLQTVTEDLHMVRVNLKNLSSVLSNTPTTYTVENVYSLQRLIYAVQQTVANATEYLVNDQQTSGSAVQQGKPSGVTGLVYDSTAIATSGQTTADMVIGLPWVSDDAGDTLTAMGVYSLSGPNGAQGVAVNPSTGMILVKPNATAGDYTVQYTVGNASASADVHVSTPNS